jgi:hypothetical protein
VIWYSNNLSINGGDIIVEGTFIDSVIKITANDYKLYEKPINLWVYQEIYAQDIMDKFEGTVRKCERKLQLLVDSGKIT